MSSKYIAPATWEGSVMTSEGEHIRCDTEQDIFDQLGLEYRVRARASCAAPVVVAVLTRHGTAATTTTTVQEPWERNCYNDAFEGEGGSEHSDAEG